MGRFFMLVVISFGAIVAIPAILAAHDANVYQAWLDKDVRWIITPQEKATWKHLPNERAKDEFIEQFWNRRNPSADSRVNPFKQEHYRRIAYANVHFASSVEGDLTDRGHAYIVYGDPSSRRVSTETMQGKKFPTERWNYSEKGFALEFVDQCRCGEFILHKPASWPGSPGH